MKLHGDHSNNGFQDEETRERVPAKAPRSQREGDANDRQIALVRMRCGCRVVDGNAIHSQALGRLDAEGQPHDVGALQKGERRNVVNLTKR
jgi:hypothetical protein